jgi:hypothetical protein
VAGVAVCFVGVCLDPVLAVENARALTAELLARVAEAESTDPAAGELVGRFRGESERALARAEASEIPARHRELLQDLALEWAQVAGDLLLARGAELEADRAERELSDVRTELVRSRAAVEQAQARLGRARRDVSVDASGETGAAAEGTPRPSSPETVSR